MNLLLENDRLILPISEICNNDKSIKPMFVYIINKPTDSFLHSSDNDKITWKDRSSDYNDDAGSSIWLFIPINNVDIFLIHTLSCNSLYYNFDEQKFEGHSCELKNQVIIDNSKNILWKKTDNTSVILNNIEVIPYQDNIVYMNIDWKFIKTSGNNKLRYVNENKILSNEGQTNDILVQHYMRLISTNGFTNFPNAIKEDDLKLICIWEENNYGHINKYLKKHFCNIDVKTFVHIDYRHIYRESYQYKNFYSDLPFNCLSNYKIIDANAAFKLQSYITDVQTAIYNLYVKKGNANIILYGFNKKLVKKIINRNYTLYIILSHEINNDILLDFEKDNIEINKIFTT